MKLNPFTKKETPAGRRRPNSELSPAPAAYAYRSQRADDSAPPSKRSAKPWYRRLGRRLLYLVALIIVASLLSLSTHARIIILNNGGQTLLRDQSIYKSTADQLLAGSIWNHSKLTVNTAKLDQQMQERFPELASANVTLPLLSRQPVMYLEPAKPTLILSSDSGVLVIDDAGKAILRTDIDSPVIKRLNLPQLDDKSGFTVQANRQVLPASQVRFIQNVLAQLQPKGYTVRGMSLPPASSELDISLAGQPYIVKFNLQNDDAREQAGTFLATINTLKSHNTTPSKYVDVRVAGRAYYQ